MASSVVNLPVPAGIGVGASVDTSTLGARKTIIVGGTFVGMLYVEASHNGTAFVPVEGFPSTEPGREVEISACFMRVRVTALTSGTPTVDVSGGASLLQSVTPAVPAGNGAGAAANISAMFDLKTFFVTGTFTGTVTIEISNDSTTWAPLKSFSNIDQQNAATYARFARVVRANVNPTTPGTPVVGICATSSSANPPTGTDQISGCDSAVTIEVFVDSVSGDDANDGITAATALATIGAVYRKFPSEAFGECVINVNLADDGAGGIATYLVRQIRLGSNRATATNYRYVGPAMIPIVPTSGPASAVLDAGTPAQIVDNADAPDANGRRTQLLFTTAAPGWTVNNFRGHFARITRGASQVIAEVPISQNGADTITFDNQDAVAVMVAGDLVEIVQCGATIEGTAAEIGVFLISGGNAGSINFFTANLRSNFTRLRLNGMFASGVNAVAFDRCRFAGTIAIGSGGIPQMTNSTVTVNSIAWDNARNAFQSIDPSGTFISALGKIFLCCIVSRLQLRGGMATLSRNYSSWGGASGLILTHNAALLTTGTPAYQGIAASGAGILAQGHAASCVLPTSVFNTTITGPASAALQVSTGAAIAYGTAGGEFDEVAGYNGKFTRQLEGTATAPTGSPAIIRRI